MARRGIWVQGLTPARKAEVTAACERLIAATKARFLPEIRPNGLHYPVDRLARASEASHCREAVAVYTARVEALAQTGGDGNYAAAVELVARLSALRPAPEQAAWLAGLRERHARKRNLMKRLG